MIGISWYPSLHSHPHPLGPFPNGQYIFAMMDQRVKYPEVEFMRITSARNVNFALERFFGSYGIPKNVVSNNGPTFALCELQGYFAGKTLGLTEQTNYGHRQMVSYKDLCNF